MKSDSGRHMHHTFTDLVKDLLTDGGLPATADNGLPPLQQSSHRPTDPNPVREDILQYIDRIRNYFTDSWKANYRKWWGEIIDHPIVASEIYNKGQQKDTTFNRNLVGNIINYLGHHGMIRQWNASNLTIALENNKDHSIRTSGLSKEPPDHIIKVLKDYVKDQSKKKS